MNISQTTLEDSSQSVSDEFTTFLDSFVSQGVEFLPAPVDHVVDGTLVLVEERDDELLVDQRGSIKWRHTPDQKEALKIA